MKKVLKAQLAQGLAQMSVELDEAQQNKLIDYVQLLSKWNKVYNLTAIRDEQEMISKHILDSLAIAPYVEQTNLIDVGCGAGLPGIPLAIAIPELQVTMLDTNGKKVRFANQAIRELSLNNATAIKSRLEDFNHAPFEQMTARAFKTINQMLSWGAHLISANGTLLAMKGVVPEEELQALPIGFEVKSIEKYRVPTLEGARCLVIIMRSA